MALTILQHRPIPLGDGVARVTPARYRSGGGFMTIETEEDLEKLRAIGRIVARSSSPKASRC